jgi:hypothetical protein
LLLSDLVEQVLLGGTAAGQVHLGAQEVGLLPVPVVAMLGGTLREDVLWL